MKIMVCGKGGCGKSTVTTLIAREFVEMGMRVLVVDMDESNFGLNKQLGLPIPEDLTMYFGSKKGIYRHIDDPEKEGAPFEDGWTFDDIPVSYSSKEGNLSLICIGKIHTADEGCACAMGTVAKEFLSNLILQDQDIVLIDAEAGVEHFGRGIDNAVDAVLMIVDPSYESIALSQKIYQMCIDIGKPINYILNKVEPDMQQFLEDNVYDPELILATVPLNREIQKNGMYGKPLDTKCEAITRMVRSVFE